MGDCNINKFALSNLGNKVDGMLNTIITLESQGYFVNDCKLTKLNNANMLIHAVESDYILDHKQKHNLSVIIDKFLAI